MKRRSRKCGGFSSSLVIVVLAVVALATVGFFVMQQDGQSDRRQTADLQEVRRGGFEVTIPVSGELVAQNQIEIRNRLETRAVIVEIVGEGTYVRKGDLLLQLNDEDIRNRIKDAQDQVNTAESALIAAEANLAIRKSASESELERAELQVILSRLAFQAWEREVDARLEQLTLALERAQMNYERLEERLADSTHLHEQDFISKDELERDRIALLEAKGTLAQAQNDIEVYRDYTYIQEKAQKENDVNQAVAELERVKQRHAAEIETARADLNSRRFQLESRRERLADLERQLEHCVVRAPSDGLVVYASSMESHRWRGDPPQVGSELSRNELVIVLPDTSRMIAAVKVNEALSGLIRPGQEAIVTSDAMPDGSMRGTVHSVGVLAETGGWRDPNRRDYTVRILLSEGNQEGLRPSMRCRAEILIDRVEDVLYVPVQAVFREGGDAFVYVPERNGFMPRRVTLGRTSELYAEIVDGLPEGARVLLRRPQGNEILRDTDDAIEAPLPLDPGASELASR